jgi:hypothetical protein
MLFELAELGVDAVEFPVQNTSVKARLDRGEFVRGWEWQALLLQGAFMWQAPHSDRRTRLLGARSMGACCGRFALSP